MVLISGFVLDNAFAEVTIQNGSFDIYGYMSSNYYNVGDQIYFANHESIDLDITTSVGNGTATAGNSFMIIPTQCGDISFTITGMGSGIISILCTEPSDGPFTLPCSMQEAGDGVSTSSCHGFYTDGIARAEVGTNYHTGLYPIENYNAIGYFIKEDGTQGSNISITHSLINPGESPTLIFENTESGFVSEFQMQMLGGDLVTEPDITSETFSVVVDGEKYSVNVRTTNVQISNILPDVDFLSLVIPIDLAVDGILEIDLKREFFDSTFQGTDNEFVVLVDGDEPEFEEIITTSTLRTLKIHLESGNEEIEIIGSKLGNDENDNPTTGTITITTDKQNYDKDDKIFISGTVETLYSGTPISLTILNPNNDLSLVKQLTVNSDKTFETIIDPDDFSFDVTGTFTIKVQYGTENHSNETTFFYDSDIPSPDPIHTTNVDIPLGTSSPGCEDSFSCYNPHEIIVDTGDIVTWKNSDTAFHTVTSISSSGVMNGIFDSGFINTGDSYSREFSNVGSFQYFCTLHPWMQGEIVVEQGTPKSESLTVRTSRSSYEQGENVLVLGNLLTSNFSGVITFMVLSPINDIITLSQINPDSDGSFSHEFLAGGTLWKESGKYEIVVKYGSLTSSYEFEFEIDEEHIPTIPESDLDYEITITTAPNSASPGCEDTAEGCYFPTTATIKTGGIVIMKNTDSAAHTFTAGSPNDGPSGIFDTGLLMSGNSFEFSPDSKGTIPYFCMVHPWMLGTIIVGEGGDVPIPTKINVNTDRNSYHYDDYVKITGTIRPADDSSITLQIFNPSGNLVYNERVNSSSNGIFSQEIKLTNEFQKSGSYTVKAIYKSISDKTEFLIKNKIPDDVPEPGPFSDSAGVNIQQDSAAPGCEETNSCYLPYEVRVNTNGKVTWYNADSAAHTVTSGTPSDGPSGVFDSGLLMAGNSFSHIFDKPGVYPYFDMVHPWAEGFVIVGQGTTPPEPEPETEINLEVSVNERIYDLGDLVDILVKIDGISDSQKVAIDVTDPRGNTMITRSLEFPSDDVDGEIQFRISEEFLTGTYTVTAITSDNGKTIRDTTHFKIKSQYNSFKITNVESTDQQGNPSILRIGEIGFIKVNLESNKSISTLVTVNLFDSELTSIGIGSVKTTLAAGTSEIILSFMIPDDAAVGPADIYVNAFSDWPSNGGIPLTGEVSSVEEIQ